MTLTTGESYDGVRRSLARVLAAERRLRGREQQSRKGGVSHTHVRAMFHLLAEGEATAGTLAKVAELNPASVTAMIDHLEAAGLVVRRRDEQDRRQCWVSLTDAGRSQVQEKEAGWRARMAAAFADVTDEELAAASKVLDRVASVMEGLADPDPVESSSSSA
jgi:MarR family transcriptional regulator, organic hydroperoxide resistance regulator